MSALKKLIASLLFAMISTSAFAITDAEVFAYAVANYPTLFAGTPSGGTTTYQGKQYDYQYYPAYGNYLAVDTSGTIYVLGPVSNGVIQSVGTVASFANLILGSNGLEQSDRQHG